MPSNKKAVHDSHILIVDTNVLWCEDKKPAVNPEVEEFLEKYSSYTDLKFHIPSVVYGETQFLQTTSAIKLHEKALDINSKLSGIIDKKIGSSVSKNSIHKLIDKKINNWMKKYKVTIVETPYSKIDWSKISHDSIWRKDTFVSDEKNKDKNNREMEKGFRDRLILETVYNLAVSNKTNKVAFITNDTLLKECTNRRLENLTNFSIYDSLVEFSTYLKLNHEKLTDKFIKSILIKASKKFFTKNNQESLYYKQEIYSKAIDSYGKFIDDPCLSYPNQTLHELFSPGEEWKPIKKSQWFISPPEFIDITNINTYNWLSKIKLAIIFKKETQLRSELINQIAPPPPPTYKVLYIEFSISWSAKVYKNGSFHDAKIKEIVMSSNVFKGIEQNELAYYQIQDFKLHPD